MDWPSKSPDLNPIENLWSIISRKVCAIGRQLRQFDSVQDLTVSLMDDWETISNEIFTSLVDSMPRRRIRVIEIKGNKTHY